MLCGSAYGLCLQKAPGDLCLQSLVVSSLETEMSFQDQQDFRHLVEILSFLRMRQCQRCTILPPRVGSISR